MSRERAIVFSRTMMLANLALLKTHTCRVMVRQPNENWKVISPTVWKNDRGATVECNFGNPGDWLWFQETYILEETDKKPADGRPFQVLDNGMYLVPHYRANEPEPHMISPVSHWQASMFMPRWISRMKRRILNVRCERIQDITREDTIAEGVELLKPLEFHQNIVYSKYKEITRYAYYWNSIYDKPKARRRKGEIVYYDSYPWSGKKHVARYKGKPHYVHPNPWAWILEYE